MTEAEWLSCKIPLLLLELICIRSSERKWRLHLLAACSRAWNHLNQTSREALIVLERYADGMADEGELHEAQRNVSEFLSCAEDESVYFACDRDWVTAKEAVYGSAGKEVIFGWAGRNEGDEKEMDREWVITANLARDIFGNPFRLVVFAPAWRTDTAVMLARQMYESREFGAMPILADALQDAGCDSEEVLNHCREGGTHVRGCWVCDLVSGKE